MPVRGDVHQWWCSATAETGLDEIAQRVRSDIVFGDQTGLQQHLDMAVVARALLYAAFSQVINATVADVQPVRIVPLYQTGCIGRAWHQFDRKMRTETRNGHVCLGCCLFEKPRRVLDREFGFGECIEGGSEGVLGRNRALSVTTESVHDNSEDGAFTPFDTDGVLILLTVADQARDRCFDVQMESCVLLESARRRLLRVYARPGVLAAGSRTEKRERFCFPGPFRDRPL